MTNYNKSFNFRNGVQVDDENFVITSVGLVGIGTSVPTKRLDVRGNADISGILTTSGLNVGAAISIGNNIIIDAASGIITATKFVGDAGDLDGIVAISTDGFVAQVGSLSTTAKVGISTDNPVFQLQIGNDPNLGTGVGITNGTLKVSGVTSTGSLIVTGLTTTKDFAVSGVSTFFTDINVDGHTNLDNVDIVGVVTITEDIHLNSSDKKIFLSSDDHQYITANASSDYIAFATNDIEKVRITQDGSVGIGSTIPASTLDVNGNTELDNLNVSGISTFLSVGISSNLHATGLSTFTDMVGVAETIFHIDDANTLIKFDTKEIKFNTNNNNRLLIDDTGVTITGLSTFNGNVVVGSSNTVGFGTTAYFSNHKKLIFGDENNLQIYSKEGHSYIEETGSGSFYINSNQLFIGNVGSSKISVKVNPNSFTSLSFDGVEKIQTVSVGASVFGQLNVASLNGGTSGLSTQYGALRYGTEVGGQPYSTRRSLDLINYDSGNINYYLDGSNFNSGIGSFVWHKGTSDPLMILTGDGKLGIGLTEPTEILEIFGNLKVSGNVLGDVTGDLNGTLLANANITSGISTFKDLKVSGITSLSGTTTGALFVDDELGNVEPFKVNNGTEVVSGLSNKFFVTDGGNVGIKTTIIYTGISVNASDCNVATAAVGVGTTALRSAVDLASAGNLTSRFMLPPSVDDTARVGLSTVTGAVIYNTSLNKLQVYNGTAWETITSSV